MVSSPRASRVSQISSTLTSHREQQATEPTENEAFILNEFEALRSLKDEHGYPASSPKDEITHKTLSPKDATSESIASMAGGFVAGVTLAISHHIFLAFLNGRDINEYPQYWVKNANNAFSALFSLCIAFVATSALIQMKWNVAGSKPLSIRCIDNLFALPSPSALFTTTTSTRLRSLRLFILPILAAIFIQSVAVVSVFAPNALTVARSEEISRDMKVKTLDLSTGPITSVANVVAYTAASPMWTTVLTSIMLRPPLVNWGIPPECGATCKFDLVYDGPGLQCMDLELPPNPNGQFFPVYNATSTLYDLDAAGPFPDPSSLWEIKDQFDLRMVYQATNSSGYTVGSDQSGVYCMFRNATYKASFRVENNTMEVNHGIQSYGGVLGTVKYGESDLQCSRNNSQPCFINGVNTLVMCQVFAAAFTGFIQPYIYGTINDAVLALLFSFDSEHPTWGFQLAVSNLSESLVSLFSNLTLGFIPHRNDTTTVRTQIWDGSYAWSYTVWILWAIYIPTLLLASLVILGGLFSIQSNKRGMGDKFSHFLLTTRNTELDDVCMDAKDFAELQRFRLLYGREGTFSVASGREYTK